MNSSKVRIAPSVLSADFGRLADEVRAVEEGGADLLHLDVMDAHFVPNLSFGPVVISAIRKLTDLFLDTHLMMTEPHKYVDAFAKAGCNGLTIHVEPYDDPRPVLRQIRDAGMRAGLSLNPPTPFEAVEPFLGDIDLLLVMSVNPGFGGQSFMEEVLPKLTRARALREGRDQTFDLEIDGGISRHTADQAVAAGAEILVAGSAVFGETDRGQAIRGIRQAGEAAVSG